MEGMRIAYTPNASMARQLYNNSKNWVDDRVDNDEPLMLSCIMGEH